LPFPRRRRFEQLRLDKQDATNRSHSDSRGNDSDRRKKPAACATNYKRGSDWPFKSPASTGASSQRGRRQKVTSSVRRQKTLRFSARFWSAAALCRFFVGCLLAAPFCRITLAAPSVP